MKIVTTIYATESHAYALAQQSARAAACFNDAGVLEGTVIIVTDKSAKAKEGVAVYQSNLPAGFKVEHVPLSIPSSENKPYGVDAQLLIARLQHAAWTAARRLRPDFVWSLESDVMPPPNALTCMLQMLQFDHSYYDIAMVTYPNGQFLGGRALPNHWIAPDVYEDERNLSEELKAKLTDRAKLQADLMASKKEPTAELVEEWRKTDAEVAASPATGNIWELNGRSFRRRGWLESAYPGVGRGAVLPSDWVGLGCTLMSSRAVNAAHFEGYEGKGTQDLWLVHRCWGQFRMCVIPHIVAHHIKKNETGSLNVLFARHEEQGEFVGHLRADLIPWKEIC